MSTPRIRAAKSAERPDCRRGKAKPRQPGSSQAPPRPGISNLSCPLQTLNGEGQQEADDLQLETSGRHRVDLPGKQRAQVTENRLDVLASGLAQKLLPCSHWPLGSLLALGFEVQADLS